MMKSLSSTLGSLLRSVAASSSIAVLLVSCVSPEPEMGPSREADVPSEFSFGGGPAKPRPDLVHEKERRIRNLQQLTFGGQNAEAYFSRDGKQLIFQSLRGDLECDQIFTMGIDGSDVTMVSTGKGRTTCSYFAPDGKSIVYSSTHMGGDACPEKAPRIPGVYVWEIFDTYDIFSANPDGSQLKQLTSSPGYDAEPTYSPDGSRIVFTSMRTGDLEVYTMKADGSDVKQLTSALGYDGGAFFSPDGSKICYRASRPDTKEAQDKYKELLTRSPPVVEPSKLEIMVMNADGSDQRQITSNGSANFCPFFHPSGQKLIYASNKADPKKRNFDLFLVDLRSGDEEQITFDESFDGFPMFSPDGRLLVWGGNRGGLVRGETNVFIAEWVD